MARDFDPMELRKSLRIDKHNLDEEVEQQAELYYEVAEAAILAKSRYAEAEEELKQVQADVDLQIRKKADKAEDRTTEKQIHQKINRSEEYRDAASAVLQARENYERLDALQTSFRQRSYMLRDLVELHIAGYYTSRSVGGSSNRQKDAKVDRVRRRLDEERKGTRKDKRSKSRRRRQD